jgi:hypothetical protein
MKSFIFVVALAGVWLLTSSDIAPYGRYDGYEPYFMERSELERSVGYSDDMAVRQMENPGKIWLGTGGDEIYVVERYKGVHIIDNSDPAHPVQTKFIVAPGCMDVAVKDNIIYIDNAVDLVAFDLAAGIVTKRIKDYFPAPASPTGQYYYNDSGMILVGWRKVGK